MPEIQINSATNTALHIVGIYDMPITVKGTTVRHNVIVVSHLNSNAIMGIDLIKKLGLVYAARKEKFYFEEDGPQFQTAQMETLAAEVIPAFTQMPVRMAASSKGGLRPATGLNCMATVASTEFPCLSGGPGLVVPNHAGQITMVIQNCSPVDLHLPRGTQMGTLENISEEELKPMDNEKLLEAMKEAEGKTNIPAPLNPQQQKEFLDKLNLHVPEDEKKLYEQLILQNHDVFSKTKDDLGKANNFTHKIFTKTDEPVFQKQYPIPDAHRKYLEVLAQVRLQICRDQFG